jgi:tetratricopeptide (TPR) repeat protein
VKRWLAAFAALIVLAACSSSPRETGVEVERKNRAAQYAEFGSRYFATGQYTKALDFFYLALENNTSVYNLEGMAANQNSLGKVYLAQGDENRALRAFATAAGYATEGEVPNLAAQAENNVGEMLLARGETDEALARFRNALEILPSGYNEEEAVILHNIGVGENRLGNFEAALAALQQAYDLNAKGKRFAEMGANAYSIASTYSLQGQYDLAVQYATDALKYDRLAENSLGIIQDFKALGKIHEKMGDVDSSFRFFLMGLKVAESLSLSDIMVDFIDEALAVGEGVVDDQELDALRSLRASLE